MLTQCTGCQAPAGSSAAARSHDCVAKRVCDCNQPFTCDVPLIIRWPQPLRILVPEECGIGCQIIGDIYQSQTGMQVIHKLI